MVVYGKYDKEYIYNLLTNKYNYRCKINILYGPLNSPIFGSHFPKNSLTLAVERYEMQKDALSSTLLKVAHFGFI